MTHHTQTNTAHKTIQTIKDTLHTKNTDKEIDLFVITAVRISMLIFFPFYSPQEKHVDNNYLNWDEAICFSGIFPGWAVRSLVNLSTYTISNWIFQLWTSQE
jgi:hypothetical protein